MTERSNPGPDYYDQEDSDQTCFLCGEPKYHVKYDVKHFGFPFTFKECQCGLIKQTPMPNEKFFEWFYNDDIFFASKGGDSEEDIWGYYDYFSDEPSRMATSRHRYRKLKFLFEGETSLKIMKVGPATGTFLHVLKEKGHDVLGCDVSSQFSAWAMEHYGVQIDVGRFEKKGYEAASFDRLFLFNVVENIPNLEEFIQEVHRTVKPGGYFVLNLVDMHRNIVEHLQKDKYFIYRPPVCYAMGLEVLYRMLRKYGFEPERKLRDTRFMHMEKITTLLRMKWLHKMSRAVKGHRFVFPIYAYPSWIVVARRT